MRELLEPRLQEVPGCNGTVHAAEGSIVGIAAGEGTVKESRVLLGYWCRLVQGCYSTADKVSGYVLECVVGAIINISQQKGWFSALLTYNPTCTG